MEKVKKWIAAILRIGIPFKACPGHIIRLELTQEHLTVPTGLSLFYALGETLEVARTLDKGMFEPKNASGGIPSRNIFWP